MSQIFSVKFCMLALSKCEGKKMKSKGNNSITEAFFLKAIQELREFIRQIPEIRKQAEAKTTKLEVRIEEGFKEAGARDFRLGMKMDEGFREVDKKAQQYRDKILTGQDKIVKELQDIREENAAGELRIRRIEKKVNSLENPKN